MLTKEAIVAAKDLPIEEVEVPEWGGSVTVKGMSLATRSAYETACFKDGKFVGGNFRAEIVARCIVDETGNRIFSDTEVELLAGKSGAALERIFPVALRLCGMGDLETTKGN